MPAELRGRVWLLGVDVDEPMLLGDGTGCDPLRPGLGSKFSRGDMLWAGEGFGLGSRREDGARQLVEWGVRLVLARGFAREFYRNAINVGLPVAIGDPEGVDDGDELVVDLVAGRVHDRTRDSRVAIQPVPPALRPILEAGGLVRYLREHKGLSGAAR